MRTVQTAALITVFLKSKIKIRPALSTRSGGGPGAVRRHRSFTGKTAVIIISLLFWSNYTAAAPWSEAAPATPAARDLESAIRTALDTDHGSEPELKEALSKLNRAAADPLLKPWGFVYQGRLLERLNRPAEALQSFETVASKSPASLDAAAGIIRIKLNRANEKPFSFEKLAAEIEKLLVKIEEVERSDLKEELLFNKARCEQMLSQEVQALQTFRQLRSEYPAGRFRFQAAEASQELRRSLSLEKAALGEDRLAEARLWFAEEEYQRALAELQDAAAVFPKGSELLGALLLLEERIMRKLGRLSEADHLLERIVSGTAGADEALLRIAKSAWNKNNHKLAREKLSELLERFPDSSLADDARYSDGRILEELKIIPDAREAYRELIEKDGSQQFKIKAMKRLGWIAYRSGDFGGAALTFSQMRGRIQDYLQNDAALSQPAAGAARKPGPADRPAAAGLSRKERNDFADEYVHASYWFAVSAQKAAELSQRLPKASPPAADVLALLASRPAAGYYSMRAAERLKPRPAAVQSGPGQACSTANDEPVLKLLGTGPYESSQLRQLAEHEIAWRYGPRLRPLDPLAGSAAEREQYWTLSSQRLALLAGYGTPHRIVSLAHGAIRSARWELAAGRGETPCIGAIIATGHPRPYSDRFGAAAKEFRVPLPLLYGIARTESHFDPNARSVAGALGLMQLMPNTAVNEGLKRNENPIDPAVNIRLGAKHISGLLAAYQDPVQAIAAYNGGKPAVAQWLDRYPGLSSEEWIEQIGFPETLEYVKKVLYAGSVYGR